MNETKAFETFITRGECDKEGNYLGERLTRELFIGFPSRALGSTCGMMRAVISDLVNFDKVALSAICNSFKPLAVKFGDTRKTIS